MNTKEPYGTKATHHRRAAFPFFKLDLSNACSSYCAKISMKIAYKALGQEKVFLTDAQSKVKF